MPEVQNQPVPEVRPAAKKGTQEGPRAKVSGASAVADSGGFFLRLSCSMCEGRFVLDVEEWRTPPDESELTGRKFLGIPPESTLCPFCLSSVQLAGAEYIYWRVAHA